MRARSDLSDKRVYRFTTVQITVIYRCIFLLLSLDGIRCSWIMRILSCNFHTYLDGVALYNFDYQTCVVVSYEAMQIMGITPVFWLHFTEEISTVCTCCNNLEHIA